MWKSVFGVLEAHGGVEMSALRTYPTEGNVPLDVAVNHQGKIQIRISFELFSNQKFKFYEKK
jgi:hypothetical protein